MVCIRRNLSCSELIPATPPQRGSGRFRTNCQFTSLPALRKLFFLAEYLVQSTRISLPLAELESLACAFLPVFLALLGARVTGKKSSRLQLLAQLCVELNQGTSNTQADGA